MENVSKRVKGIAGVLIAVFLLAALFSIVNDNREKAQSIKELRQQNTSLKNNEGKLSAKYTHLSEQYNSLNKEKNGSANEALLDTTNKLFNTVYSYDTSKRSDSVAARKTKAEPYANTTTLDALFSKDADKLTPSVTTVSELEGQPDVYRMSSDENDLTAMVLVNYSLSIAGSEKQEGKFLYKIVFDPAVKQVTEIKNIGEISIP